MEQQTAKNGEVWFEVGLNELKGVCEELKAKRNFDTLSCLTGTDKKDSLEVVYHLFSYVTKESLTIKVNILKDSAEAAVDSVSSIWTSANWMERETFDMLGIKFKGHPNMKRILMPDDWTGHPLRKDYTDPEEYHGMSTRRYT